MANPYFFFIVTGKINPPQPVMLEIISHSSDQLLLATVTIIIYCYRAW